MAIHMHAHLMMFRYEVTSGTTKVDVIQFKDQETGRWGEVIVSSIVHFGCGPGIGRTPFEMLNEIDALADELRTVLAALDNARIALGDDYVPPLIPFKDEYMPKYASRAQLRAAVTDLYIALLERDRCANCGGQGWEYYTIGEEVNKETCQCSIDAEEALARQRDVYEKTISEDK